MKLRLISLATAGMLVNALYAHIAFAFNETLLRGAQITAEPVSQKLSNAFVAGVSQGAPQVSSNGFALGMYTVPAGEVAGAATYVGINTLVVNLGLFGLLALALSLLAAMVLEPRKKGFEN
jgi:hypothetical protein